MKKKRNQVIRDFVLSWMHKAEADLQAAERLLELDQVDFFPAAFHAQQAAEKFLKALLVRDQTPFPKTHNIEQLLDLADRPDTRVKQALSGAAMLTPFGTDFRYPGDEMVPRELAERAVEEAARVQATVMQYLREYIEKEKP